jgi:hypothetical protein
MIYPNKWEIWMSRISDSEKITTIPIRRGTRDKINKFRDGGESWDEFVVRISDILKKNQR